MVQVKAGSRVEQVMVTQFKKELFWLPYFGDDTSRSAVEAYEARRNSVLSQEYPILLEYDLNDPDKVWSAITYQYLRGSGGVEGDYALSIIYTEKKELFDDRKAFDSFLTRRGFEKVGTDHYRHNRYDYDVSIDDYDMPGVTVVLTYRPKQPKAYPTWGELPIYPQYNHLTHVGDPWSWADVQEYEAEMNDGAEYFDYDDYHVFAVFGDPHFYSREYEISKNSSSKLDSFGYATSDLDKVFFEHEGKYYMTDEMFALLDKAGFTYIIVYPDSSGQFEYIFNDRNNPHSLLYVSRFIDDELMKGVQLAYFGTD